MQKVRMIKMSDSKVVVHKHYNMGRGAYRLIGIWSAPSQSLSGTNPRAYNIAMDTRPKCCHMTCDHCGTGIIHHFIIKDEDGKEFCVGSSCIDKLGQQDLITKAKAMENERKRKLRQAQAEKKRQERHEAVEAELECQRKKNGGLTNKEMLAKQQRCIKNDFADKYREVSAPITELLSKAGGNFCESIISSLESGNTPKGSGKGIVIEIMTKQTTKSRKNSEAYNDALERMTEVFLTTEEKINDLREDFQRKLEAANGYK
ncbi:hypothetical protein [Photobacterium kishitanii]|uniref:Uncharacterized protein n=1 Tax=Photobacterium kishitanii TaxID=318456 RepID=A0A2T3KL40_9GAMM|nr:hypothetical protein [Photobacterium kishitanii]PSV00373.1 hypothetical protein C9J27_04395 [Photobacterium kishitanii]